MKKQILVIDDSKAIRFLLQTVLSKNYKVITMPDGCSSMYWLSKRNFPDLIIADPQLPDMENWELIQQLFSNGMYTSIPIMVLSGLDKEETAKHSGQFGVAHFFLKPFNPLDLVREVDALFQKKKVYDGPSIDIS